MSQILRCHNEDEAHPLLSAHLIVNRLVCLVATSCQLHEVDTAVLGHTPAALVVLALGKHRSAALSSLQPCRHPVHAVVLEFADV
jgi:hypothetical protein